MTDNDEESKPFDKNKLAVALTYERGKSDVPTVSAKGKGFIAVRQDSDLVVLLSKLDIDMPIPLEAYAAVAEILAYVYKANDKARRKNQL